MARSLLASKIETGLLLKDEPNNSPARAPRPGFCTEGEIYQIKCNHFLIRVTAPQYYKYTMVLAPEVKSRGLKRVIMACMADFFDGTLSIFDGENIFYTAKSLPFESENFPVKPRNHQEFIVTIRLVDRVELNQIHSSCVRTFTKIPQKAARALDAVLREIPSLSDTTETETRSFISRILGGRTYISDGLECLKGFRQSLCLTQMGLSLHIDALKRVFYKPMNVAKFAMDYLKIHKGRDREGWEKLQQVLMGVRVEVNHRNEGIMEYSISGVTMEPLRNLKFPGTMTSIENYFTDQYNCKFNADLPCLLFCKYKYRMFLPMELCDIIGGQKFSKTLNKKQMAALLSAEPRTHYHREMKIAEVVQHANILRQEFSDQFGFSVENPFVRVDARVLPAPLLRYHDTGENKTCVPSVGQWNMNGKKVIHGGTVQRWACLNFSCVRQDIISTFCDNLVAMCESIGMVINLRSSMDIQLYKIGEIVEEEDNLRRIFSGFQGLDLLIVILPEDNASFFYKYTKTVCETQLGIVSQCCLPKNVVKSRKRYLENIALKINVKVGGNNTCLDKPLNTSWCDSESTIIFGVHVNHPPPGDLSSPSIAAVVASMGWPNITRYSSAFSTQQQRREIIADLFSEKQDPQEGTVYGGMIRELLIGYMNETSVLPQRIIVYRGGVSEGQFNNVLLHELSAIRKACQSLRHGYEPRVTFVVLQKSRHTRFFPAKRGKESMIVKSGNILPGTVIDKEICHPSEFDFYLCSHAVLQGSSRPTHYHVLFDENGFSANEIQVLTNNLCYTSARCTRSLSIVPPVYYAHLVAARARCYIETRSLGCSTGSGSEFKTEPEIEPIPTVKENLKEGMYYC